MSENSTNYALSAARASLATAKQRRKQAQQEQYTRDLGGFIVDVLGYTEVEPVGVHRPLLRSLSIQSPFLLLLLPRGSFKSTITSVSYPLWRLAKNHDLRILIDSETDRQSRVFLDGIKNHIERNETFRDIFGDWKNIPGWTADSITVANRDPRLKDPSVQATGLNKPVTGGHYDLIIVDDIHSDKNSQTEDTCTRVINHWKALFPILEPDGQMIVVGTRWSTMDLYGHLLSNESCLIL